MKNNLLAPNGQPSNLTAEQYKLVRTKAFKDWFGDWQNDPVNASKVVDDNGEPLVVYHNSDALFNQFDLSYFGKSDGGYAGVGFYFSPTSIKGYGKYVYQCFLSLKNPLIRTSSNWKDPFMPYLWIPNRANERKEWSIRNASIEWTNEVKKNGYDGFIDEGGEIVAFEPTQIKLADGTNTTFDADNPDIRYEDGGEVRKFDKKKYDYAIKKYFDKLSKEDVIALRSWVVNLDESIDGLMTRQEAKNYIKNSQNIQSVSQEFIKDIFGEKNFKVFRSYEKKKNKKDLYSFTLDKELSWGVFRTKYEKDITFKDVLAVPQIAFYKWKEKESYDNEYELVVKATYHDGGEIEEKNFNNGGQMDKIKKGGITYGKSHDEGGIPVKNASTGQMLEVEGGEGIVNKRSMASEKQVKLNGKQMSICEAVSHLNQLEGGVKFSCDDVAHRQFIEEMALGGELERGIRTEKEHIETLRKLYEKRITPSVAVEEVAKEHIAENPNYYSDLQNMESIKRQAETMPTTAPYDMMFPFGNKRLADINKVSYEKNADLKLTDIREFEDGGISGRICGCKNHKRKYLDGGMFDSGFGSLDSFIGQNQKKDESSKNAEYSLEVIEKARKLLDKDYLPMILSSSMSDKYKIYFQHLKKLNLYQDGWRFKFGQSREWAGLCAYNGLVFDKKKTLYLSINYVKHDNNWLENEKDVVLHEMAHAIVDEYIITKIADFGGLDPAHKLTEGHGEAWEQVCKAINPDGDCGRFYTNAQLKDSFQPYMYDCGFCGTKKYSRNRNFTNICFKCNKPVIVIKND